jgi:hypothetical protein
MKLGGPLGQSGHSGEHKNKIVPVPGIGRFGEMCSLYLYSRREAEDQGLGSLKSIYHTIRRQIPQDHNMPFRDFLHPLNVSDGYKLKGKSAPVLPQ